jgi:acetylornithine deacetylase
VHQSRVAPDVTTAIDAWINSRREELVALMAHLVQTQSQVRPPAGSELECQRLVEAEFRRAGAEVDVFTPTDVPGLRNHPLFFGTWDGMARTFDDRPNVVGTFRGTGGGRSLLLSTHIDTVGPEPLPWSVAEPFGGEVKDGKLYGRGSWDTKWGIAVGLFAASCIRELRIPIRGDVLLESVVDEEFGGSHGVLAARLRGYNADIAINSEPTAMVAAAAHRGGGEWRITVRGDAGLAFGDRLLSNSVYKLSRLIDGIRDFDMHRNSEGPVPALFESDPLLPSYILQVSGGGTTYADAAGVPAECSLIVWVEEFPGVDEATHTAHLTSHLNGYLERDHDFDGVYPEYRKTVRYLPGSGIDPSHEFFGILGDAFSSIGREFRIAGAPFAADTYVFNLYSSTPALTLGPRGGNAHGADEFVVIEDVVDLTRIYARAMVAWCG